MEQAQLTISVGANSPGTSLTVKLDDQIIWQGDPGSAPGKISHSFDDVDGAEHLLVLELSGKKIDDTTVDETGNIVKDLLISIGDFSFDEINVDQLVWNLSEYHHDFNGTQPPTISKFYGDMGCNGAVSLRFTSPIYLWILENL